MKRKKIALIALSVCCLLLFAGCGSGTDTAHGASKTGMMDQLIAAEESSGSGSSEADPSAGAASAESASQNSNPDLVLPPDTLDDIPADGGNFGLGVPTEAAPPTLNGTTDGIDVDLTTMNSNMVYAEVSNMVYYPEQYVGKKVRMNGSFVLAYGNNEGEFYYACLIADATACCSQGIEFVRAGDYSYPQDYPELGDEITVTGIFEIYTDASDGLEYLHLVDAVMTTGA